jgi:hypothetical protein
MALVSFVCVKGTIPLFDYRGHCIDSVSIPDYDDLRNAPPQPLTQDYYKCRDNECMNAFLNSLRYGDGVGDSDDAIC